MIWLSPRRYNFLSVSWLSKACTQIVSSIMVRLSTKSNPEMRNLIIWILINTQNKIKMRFIKHYWRQFMLITNPGYTSAYYFHNILYNRTFWVFLRYSTNSNRRFLCYNYYSYVNILGGNQMNSQGKILWRQKFQILELIIR